MEVKKPTLEGNKLTFDIEREFNGRAFTMTYQGIIKAAEISGWRMMEFNGSPRDRAWNAIRQ
ncbi:MAG TPA: hypothetical protein EYQ50_18615 [Verrucomicrobiales bacterium]|nr:hypothetical protein [Verrucomicrobiales bacterium]HIL69611.1 hypothetical protein [Verrucomicrobiota bacterium]